MYVLACIYIYIYIYSKNDKNRYLYPIAVKKKEEEETPSPLFVHRKLSASTSAKSKVPYTMLSAPQTHGGFFSYQLFFKIMMNTYENQQYRRKNYNKKKFTKI